MMKSGVERVVKGSEQRVEEENGNVKLSRG